MLTSVSDLTITGARKLDVLELQSMARKGICRFVEFRPFVEDGGDVTKNAFMVQQFANKLANSALVRFKTKAKARADNSHTDVYLPFRASAWMRGRVGSASWAAQCAIPPTWRVLFRAYFQSRDSTES